MTKPYFPLYLPVEGKKCLIVGGGATAAKAAQHLLDGGADLSVFSTARIDKKLAQLQKKELIEVLEREPEADDLFGVWLILALSENPFLDERMAKLAKMEGVLCAVQPGAEGGDFLVAPTVRRGLLVCCCSSSGISGVVDDWLKAEMEKAFGKEYDKYLELLSRMKVIVEKSFSDKMEREKIFQRIIETNLLDMVRSGDAKSAERTALKIVATSTRKF